MSPMGEENQLFLSGEHSPSSADKHHYQYVTQQNMSNTWINLDYLLLLVAPNITAILIIV